MTPLLHHSMHITSCAAVGTCHFRFLLPAKRGMMAADLGPDSRPRPLRRGTELSTGPPAEWAALTDREPALPREEASCAFVRPAREV